MEYHIYKKFYISSRDKRKKLEKKKEYLMHYVMDISNGWDSSLLYNNSKKKSVSLFRKQLMMLTGNGSSAYRICCRKKKISEKQSLRMQKSNNMKLQNASNEVALIQFYI